MLREFNSVVENGRACDTLSIGAAHLRLVVSHHVLDDTRLAELDRVEVELGSQASKCGLVKYLLPCMHKKNNMRDVL